MPSMDHVLSDFDFELPEHLLAEYPADKRDHSRLMVVSLADKTIQHRHFYEIGEFFQPDDLLVMNDTKVIPARMLARKEFMKGAALQVLLVEESDADCPAWIMLVDPIKKVRLGTRIVFGENQLIGEIAEFLSEKEVLVKFPDEVDTLKLRQVLFDLGNIPLPPYIRRPLREEDNTRYQTVFAKNDGALAAPTAGLHFTPELLSSLNAYGVDSKFLTLTIGMGTFNPIYKEDLNQFNIHSESFDIPAETADEINQRRAKGGRIVAVGTTTFRAIESATDAGGVVQSGKADSTLFVRPGYAFKSDVSLLTNFHTPKSSLLMLISAFMGYEFTREVYRVAIEEEYRFFSYGDAMLILR